ncbi:MAG: GMC family oxidoreductase [Dehalococcoidia bacterium]
MSNEPVGVLIIGAGASGAAFAWSIADTGASVLCLEQGPWMHQKDYPTNFMDWETRAMGPFATNPNVRGLAQDYPVNDSDSPIQPLMFNAVGGSTILWAAHFPRFTPGDFRVKTDDGVADDWPISYETLEPFYAVNDRMMGVSGLAGDPAYPPHQPPLPPLPLGETGNIVARGFERLGWHWWPSDSAITSTEYNGRAPCINLGSCGSGCSQGAKASTDITYWPVAERKGVQLRTNCRVKEITVRPDGMADGVLYYDADGVLQEQKAEIVVLACNGIGTPRLLLNSKSARHPDGLANSSGLVGKNLMHHPYALIRGIFDEPLHGRAGPGGCTFWSHQFYKTDPANGFVRGYSYEGTRGMGPATTALWGMATGRVPWGEGHHAAFDRLNGHTAGMVGITEDLPDEANTVTLDPELTDSHGIPAPKVTYTLSDNSRKQLAHAVERGTEALLAAGAVETYSEPLIKTAGWHLMGTARMGTDPKRSVVNEWGRAHDVKNLFIIDGSIFVTSAGVNPTSTIQALALYIADRIKHNMGNLFD